MNSIYIRENLKDFKPYKAGEINDKIKLDANENPYPMLEEIKKKVISYLEKSDGFSVYPDSDSRELRKVLADKYKLEIENIVCGVGSDQIIDCLIRGVIMPGDKVVYPTPSFSMYESVVKLNHGECIEVELEKDFSYNIDEMIRQTNINKAKLLILCTPNNPTGNSIALEDIRKIANNVDCLVMVDEAYGEFQEESTVDLVKEGIENLVVLRTFSKAYGLAGLRIGYALGSEKAVYPINISKPPYNVNTFTQAVAKITMENSDLYSKQIKLMNDNKNNLEKALKDLGLKVYPSEANFLLVEFDDFDLYDALFKKGIQIRKMYIREKHMYRISIGKKEEIETLVDTIRRLVNVN